MMSCIRGRNNFLLKYFAQILTKALETSRNTESYKYVTSLIWDLMIDKQREQNRNINKNKNNVNHNHEKSVV